MSTALFGGGALAAVPLGALADAEGYRSLWLARGRRVRARRARDVPPASGRCGSLRPDQGPGSGRRTPMLPAWLRRFGSDRSSSSPSTRSQRVGVASRAMMASSSSSTARFPATASWRASSASSAATARRSRTSACSGGPDRVDAPCPHFGTCGGCRWQDLRYERQLEHKQQQVLDALQRIAGLPDPPVEPIVPAVRQYAYRNKLEYAWTGTPAGVSLGFHRAGRWEEIVPLEVCLLTGDKGNAVREAFVAWARAQGLEAYDQRDHTGYLRHLVVREGVRTGELLCILVTSPATCPASRSSRRC